MSLAAYICHADGDRLEAAHAFLADLREGDATITVAGPDEITPLVGRALGLTAVAAQRVAVDPGGVTLLHHTPDGDLTACMVNVTPADPLRRGVAVQRRLYLIRHGEADTPDADGRLHSHVPLPLTPRGRWQAGVLREAFAPVPADRVHASDIARAEETARRLAGPRREVRLDVGLRELSLGDFEGAHSDDVLAAAPGFLVDPDAALPGGESIRDVGRRARPALDRILAGDDGDDVVVVAHGGVNRSLLGSVLDIPLERAVLVRQDWACVNVLERSGDGWALGALNWTPAGIAELDQARRVAHLHEQRG